VVVHGDARGRTLGFPTANVALQPGALPPRGVYAVEAVIDGETWPAVANLGVRPTFGGDEGGGDAGAGGDGRSLEVHVLDFGGDLYGRELEVTFRQRLRDERRFDDVGELTAQIGKDVAAARAGLRA
jgi:riboflavin kinase/FMN adenylyltransferase